MITRYIDATRVYENLTAKTTSREDIILRENPSIYKRIIKFGECELIFMNIKPMDFLSVVSIGQIEFGEDISLDDILNNPKTDEQSAAKEKIESIYKQFYDKLPR